MKSTIALLLCSCLLIGCETGKEEPARVTIGQAPASMTPPQNETTDAPADPAEHQAPVVAPTQELHAGTPEQLELLDRAKIAFIAEYQEQAEEYFYELATSSPVSGATVSAAIALGQIYIESGRAHEALALMDDLQESVAELPEVLLVTGRVYSSLNEPMKALRAYDRALQHQPDYIFLYVDMAELLFQVNEQERGAQLLTRYEHRLVQLASVLESPDQTTEAQRLYVLDIFSMVDDERAHQALLHAFDDPSAQVRKLSAELTATFRLHDALEPLERLAIDDPDREVRQTARAALSRIRG